MVKHFGYENKRIMLQVNASKSRDLLFERYVHFWRNYNITGEELGDCE